MKKLKKLKKLILICILIIVIFFSYILGNIFYYELASKPVKSDVIIVLGCQINGRTPSLMLQDRLKKALYLYKNHYAEYIIASGGKGSGENITEAEAMKNWLLKNGIPRKRIFTEESSTSTYENLKFSKAIMLAESLKTAIIVSNEFHIYRSLRLAGELGIKATGAPAPTVYYLRLYYHLREIISVIKSYIFYG